MDSVELAPFRPMDDFLLKSAQFQVPNVKDPNRVVNRIINNLLYYQTNYFVTILGIFLIVGILHPVQMVLGCATVTVAFCGYVYASENMPDLRRFKRNHPGASMFIIMLAAYFLIYLFGSVIVFLFGIALPLLLVITHAAMRLRNLKNKVNSKIEYVGIKRTPMGVILESLGMEQEAGS